MSVVVIPQLLSAAASEVAGVGAAVGAANAAAVGPTTGLLAAAQDEVSAAVAALFSTHGLGYQVLSAHAAAFHEQFVPRTRWCQRRLRRRGGCQRLTAARVGAKRSGCDQHPHHDVVGASADR